MIALFIASLGWPIALGILAWALELRRENRRLRAWQRAAAIDDAVRNRETLQ